MNNKKIIYFAIFIIGLIAISGVSANEIDSDIADISNSNGVVNTDEMNNQQISLEDSTILSSNCYEEESLEAESQLTNCNFSSLNSTINDNYDSEINLNTNYTFNNNSDSIFTNGINITRSLTINGNGHTINANNQARIFRILNNNTVIFKDIIFINGKSSGVNSIIRGNCTVINCTFINNSITIISESQAINCSFIQNNGSSINKGIAINCSFINSYGSYNGGAISSTSAINCTFKNCSSKNFGGAISCYEDENLTFYNNTFINCTSTRGGAIYIQERSGSIYDGYLKYIHIVKCNFIDCFAEMATGAIYAKYYSSGEWGNKLNLTDCNFVNCYSNNGSCGVIYWSGVYGLIYNCNFTNSHANTSSGAITFDELSSCNLSNCNFINCSASEYGGAIIGKQNCNSYNFNNCNFISCFCSEENGLGGAIYWVGDSATFKNCSFLNNHAKNSGAIYFLDISKNNIIENCKFFNNTAIYLGGAIWNDGNNLTISDCNFKNNKVLNERDPDPVNYTNCFGSYEDDLSISSNAKGTVVINSSFNRFFTELLVQNITTIFNYESYLVATLKDNNGNELYNLSLTISINGKNSTLTTNLDGQIKFSLKNLPSGSYNAVISFAGNDYYDDVCANAKVVVNKGPTKLAVPSITAVYQVSKNLVATLKDSKGNVLANKKITIKVGTISKTLKTNSKGQVSIAISSLVPKTYTATISFAGDNNYTKSSTTAKVVVKKATPKMTAKAKTFKVKVKTKKYTITLKNNKGKVMKSTKVTLKVNKKTFTAKTNSKGVATFKITNLKKKGKFTATITYAGSKYYNKVTKKPKITVK